MIILSNASTWELYDLLIDGIPKDLTVKNIICGTLWTLCESSDGGIGLAMTVNARSYPPVDVFDYDNMPLHEAALLSKSWNFIEAAIGMAAMNSYYNNASRVRALGALFPEPGSNDQDAFFSMFEDMKGKKVATVGSFPKLLKGFDNICELTVIEKEPGSGEYPDSASEFLLPRQDLVFITGSSFVNKTLPRLLQLAEHARIVLLGPTTPLCPKLFEYGISCLAGYVSTDDHLCKKIAACGNFVSLRRAGERIRLFPKKG